MANLRSQPTEPSSASPDPLTGSTRRAHDKVKWRPASISALDIAAVIALLVAALGIYGRYATKGGWYYDDWSTFALLREQHGGFFAQLHACARSIPGGRALACVYDAGEYSLFGAHRSDYQFAAIAFLVLNASLIYTIARQCRLPRPWAFLIGAAFVLFPASDSTRLWVVGAIGQYVVAIVLVAVLVSLSALRRRGPSAFALHLLSATLVVVAMATYEIALPLVALGGAAYYLCFRDRRALKRWAVDIGLITLFLIYRLVVVPVSSETGLIVHRDASQTIHRVQVLLNGAWSTWKFVYVPGTLGTIALVTLAVTIAALLLFPDSGFGGRAMRWFVIFAFGFVLATAGALVYLTANDLYVPEVAGTFNRLNLPGSLGYVAMAVAILGLLYEVLRTFKLQRPVAGGLVVLVVVGSAVHQVGVSREHIRSWEASWSDQEQALKGYRVALRGAPHTAEVIGFDVPIWERGWIPVFAASWDLRGAIDYETPVDPPVAYPLLPTLTCGLTGMVEGGTLIASYNQLGAPLYFVSPVRRAIVRVKTKSTCERIILAWGRPPFWGSTVTGVTFRT
jgi:hypothetical protein